MIMKIIKEAYRTDNSTIYNSFSDCIQLTKGELGQIVAGSNIA